VLLKTNEGLLNTPEPVIEPPDTVTVPTASFAFICNEPALMFTGEVAEIAPVEPTTSTPAVTLTEPLYEFCPDNVVVPVPLCNNDTPLIPPELAGVPASGALTDTATVLLKTNEGLLNTPEPVMDPPLMTTELTALPAVINKVPPLITMLPAVVPPFTTLLIAFVTPISRTPLLTIVVPVYVLARNKVVVADPLSVTPPDPASTTFTVKFEIFAKLNPEEALSVPPPVIAPP
jgi:hypothetical protein